ncbi:MAG: hypothetical protein ACOCPR_06820 [Guyparkeria sp.]
MSIESVTAEAAFGAFAELIKIDGSDAWAIVHERVNIVGQMGEVIDQRAAIDLLIADGHNIVGGTPVTVRGKSYRIDQPDGTWADPAVARVLLK